MVGASQPAASGACALVMCAFTVLIVRSLAAWQHTYGAASTPADQIGGVCLESLDWQQHTNS